MSDREVEKAEVRATRWATQCRALLALADQARRVTAAEAPIGSRELLAMKDHLGIIAAILVAGDKDEETMIRYEIVGVDPEDV